MKKVIFKISAIVLLIILMFYNVQEFSSENNQSFAIGSQTAKAVPTPMACYTDVYLDCWWGLGTAKMCNFTGSYGPPTSCSEYSCGTGITNRHCIAVS